ncbi:MAG: hypothetical protein KAW12_29060 [Candidatus Aminicenantes bacterium]|nr:hypothetical protein [Candidatus Aminicenantes bacterium]
MRNIFPIGKKSFICGFIVFTLCLSFPARPGLAKVTGMEITFRGAFAGGKEFGKVGAYETIRGKLHYCVDPANPANARIVDLKYAPRDKNGNVCFSGDFVLLKPLDLKKGSGRLLFDVTNRGGIVALGALNDDGGWVNSEKDPGSAG